MTACRLCLVFLHNERSMTNCHFCTVFIITLAKGTSIKKKVNSNNVKRGLMNNYLKERQIS